MFIYLFIYYKKVRLAGTVRVCGNSTAPPTYRRILGTRLPATTILPRCNFFAERT